MERKPWGALEESYRGRVSGSSGGGGVPAVVLRDDEWWLGRTNAEQGSPSFGDPRLTLEGGLSDRVIEVRVRVPVTTKTMSQRWRDGGKASYRRGGQPALATATASASGMSGVRWRIRNQGMGGLMEQRVKERIVAGRGSQVDAER